jgi:hypothetical protein
MPPTSFTFKGDKEMIAKVRAVGKKYPVKAKKALFRGCEKVMTRSKREFCPVDKGTMRSTGIVVADEKEMSVTLAYGGPAAPYTVRQHEDETLVHKNGKSAKFLEKPLMEAAPTILADIAKEAQFEEEDTK